jgi:hypothetical protein
MFVAKLDPAGNHLWSMRFVEGNAYGLATDGAGNALLAGSFVGTVDFGGGPLTSVDRSDIVVAKLAP